MNSNISKTDNELWYQTFTPSKHKNYVWLLRTVGAFIYRLDAKRTLTGKTLAVSAGNSSTFRDQDVAIVYKACCVWVEAEVTIKARVPKSYSSIFNQFTRSVLDREFFEKAKDMHPAAKWGDFRFLLTSNDEVPKETEEPKGAMSQAESRAAYATFTVELMKAEEEGKIWDNHVVAHKDWTENSEKERIKFLEGRHDTIVDQVQKLMRNRFITQAVPNGLIHADNIIEAHTGTFAEQAGLLSEALWRVIFVNLNNMGSTWTVVLPELAASISTKICAAPERTCALIIVPLAPARGEIEAIDANVQAVLDCFKDVHLGCSSRSVVLNVDDGSLTSQLAQGMFYAVMLTSNQRHTPRCPRWPRVFMPKVPR